MTDITGRMNPAYLHWLHAMLDNYPAPAGERAAVARFLRWADDPATRTGIAGNETRQPSPFRYAEAIGMYAPGMVDARCLQECGIDPDRLAAAGLDTDTLLAAWADRIWDMATDDDGLWEALDPTLRQLGTSVDRLASD